MLITISRVKNVHPVFFRNFFQIGAIKNMPTSQNPNCCFVSMAIHIQSKRSFSGGPTNLCLLILRWKKFQENMP